MGSIRRLPVGANRRYRLTRIERASGRRAADTQRYGKSPAQPGYPHADTVDQIFDFMVRDFAEFALQLPNKASSTPEQMLQCLKMIAKPATDERRTRVLALDGAYEIPP